MIDALSIRRDFPIFQKVSGEKPLVYLDSAATTLKPQTVIDAVHEYYSTYSANVFRGIYTMSEKATQAYELSRQKVAHFIGAEPQEIIFTRNTTESINLVMYSWGKHVIHEGDELVVTLMEHHSNFVPWQQLAHQSNARFRVCTVNDEGELDMDELSKIITRKTKLLAITAASNVLGTINPLKQIIRDVKRHNPQCVVLVDGAQAVPHIPMNVHDIGADFVAFSSHKMLGPTGVGVLWGRRELLESMSPFQYGGDMIHEVRIENTSFAQLPNKFEAGTPDIAGVIGLGAAIDYLTAIGMDQVRAYEEHLMRYAMKTLSSVNGIRILGPSDPQKRGSVVSFTIEGIHAHDLAQMLDEEHICIRAGHHCAMPLHTSQHLPATARASFSVYSTVSDIDQLAVGIESARKRLNG